MEEKMGKNNKQQQGYIEQATDLVGTYVIAATPAVLLTTAVGYVTSLRLSQPETPISGAAYFLPNLTVGAYNAALVAAALVPYELTLNGLEQWTMDSAAAAKSLLVAVVTANAVLDAVTIFLPFSSLLSDHLIAYSAMAGVVATAIDYTYSYTMELLPAHQELLVDTCACAAQDELL
jgi:hypothetical protein